MCFGGSRLRAIPQHRRGAEFEQAWRRALQAQAQRCAEDLVAATASDRTPPGLIVGLIGTSPQNIWLASMDVTGTGEPLYVLSCGLLDCWSGQPQDAGTSLAR